MTVQPEKTGEVVGFLMSGLLVVFCFRPVWQGCSPTCFTGNLWFSGVLMLILAYALKSRLPYVMRMKMNYGQIFVSMAVLLKQEKRLLLRALAGGFAFCSSQYPLFNHRTSAQLGPSFT